MLFEFQITGCTMNITVFCILLSLFVIFLSVSGLLAQYYWVWVFFLILLYNADPISSRTYLTYIPLFVTALSNLAAKHYTFSTIYFIFRYFYHFLFHDQSISYSPQTLSTSAILPPSRPLTKGLDWRHFHQTTQNIYIWGVVNGEWNQPPSHLNQASQQKLIVKPD